MTSPSSPETHALTQTQRIVVLLVAFLGWLGAGIHLAITSLVMRVATADLLPVGTAESEIGKWFGWLICAFLFGAAAGGYLLGLAGDRFGRAKAVTVSICCYSVFSAVSYFVDDIRWLLVLRFLTCLGIGGMWPNGIALLAEAWSNVARPVLAGVMGTAANVGILLFAALTLVWHVEPTVWRWTFVAGATPIVLGVYAWLFLPESPQWRKLEGESDSPQDVQVQVGLADVFRPPLRRLTIIGILLGTVPLFGGWGVATWSLAWASEAGDSPAAAQIEEGDSSEAPVEQSAPDPALKSRTLISRSLPGSITSLLGGALAFYLGRKRSYLLLCIGALISTQMLFRVGHPSEPAFQFWTAMLGIFNGFFFGWLPYCLPEMFPTRVRSTGAGVSFNWGRIVTGLGVLASSTLLAMYQGRYATVGSITGFIFVLGMVVILFAPAQPAENLDEGLESP